MDMNMLRVVILCHGDEHDIWGSTLITHYLEQAFKRLGHETWRVSVTKYSDEYPSILSKRINLLICEGVPEWQVPKGVWENADTKIFWWESELFYNLEAIVDTGFDAIITNSNQVEALREKGLAAHRVNLAVDKNIINAKRNKDYISEFVFVGRYPHKTKEQMDMFEFVDQIGEFNLWGIGWEESIYKNYYKGRLPLYDVGSLYKSADIALLLTEEKQKKRGMFNNRVYEVLGAGAIALSDSYDELQKSDLGSFIYFPKSIDDIKDIYEKRNSIAEKKRVLEAQEYVLSNHNYDVRAKEILAFCKNTLNLW